jgi:hypothetical protein
MILEKKIKIKKVHNNLHINKYYLEWNLNIEIKLHNLIKILLKKINNYNMLLNNIKELLKILIKN